jgi:hypothetical protein
MTTSEAEYTPTTASVKIAYCYTSEAAPAIYQQRSEAFDRWLAAHDKAIRDAALTEAAAIALNIRPETGLHIDRTERMIWGDAWTEHEFQIARANRQGKADAASLIVAAIRHLQEGDK